MDRESQSELSPRQIVRAILNPTREEFNALLNARPRDTVQYFDIGCGIDPKVSVKLERGDLWVGCDPSIKKNGNNIDLSASMPIHPESKRIVFSDIAGEVPQFKPDYLMSIAPNPKDIVQGTIINDELEKFIDSKKIQFFLMIFDNRTVESQGYREEAISDVDTWMKEHKFRKHDSNPLRGSFKENSGDLGVLGNKYLVYIRTPKR
jgi:hypothetical protein